MNNFLLILNIYKKFSKPWDFPGGPVVKTPRFQYRGMGSTPGQETKIPHATYCNQTKNFFHFFIKKGKNVENICISKR